MKMLIPRSRGQRLTGEIQLTRIQLGKEPGSVLTPLLPAGHCLEQTWDKAGMS